MFILQRIEYLVDAFLLVFVGLPESDWGTFLWRKRQILLEDQLDRLYQAIVSIQIYKILKNGCEKTGIWA